MRLSRQRPICSIVMETSAGAGDQMSLAALPPESDSIAGILDSSGIGLVMVKRVSESPSKHLLRGLLARRCELKSPNAIVTATTRIMSNENRLSYRERRDAFLSLCNS